MNPKTQSFNLTYNLTGSNSGINIYFNSVPSSNQPPLQEPPLRRSKRKATSTATIPISNKRQKTQICEEQKKSDEKINFKWNTLLTKLQGQENTEAICIEKYEELGQKFFKIKEKADLDLETGSIDEKIQKINFLINIVHPCPTKKVIFKEEKELLEKAIKTCKNLEKSHRGKKIYKGKLARLEKIKHHIEKEHLPKLAFTFARLKSEKTAAKIDQLRAQNESLMPPSGLDLIQIRVNCEKIISLLFDELKRFKVAKEAAKEIQSSEIYKNSIYAIGLCYKRLAETTLEAKRQLNFKESGKKHKQANKNFQQYYKLAKVSLSTYPELLTELKALKSNAFKEEKVNIDTEKVYTAIICSEQDVVTPLEAIVLN